MLKKQVRIGGVYTAKVSNNVVNVRIDGVSATGRGWIATNLNTNRSIHIKSAAKLRKEVIE